jgi:hypothetical protein
LLLVAVQIGGAGARRHNLRDQRIQASNLVLGERMTVGDPVMATSLRATEPLDQAVGLAI